MLLLSYQLFVFALCLDNITSKDSQIIAVLYGYSIASEQRLNNSPYHAQTFYGFARSDDYFKSVGSWIFERLILCFHFLSLSVGGFYFVPPLDINYYSIFPAICQGAKCSFFAIFAKKIAHLSMRDHLIPRSGFSAPRYQSREKHAARNTPDCS